MRLSPPPLAIGDEDGFDKHDTFGAKHAGERLARLVADLDDHSVILIDGQWGSGKSVFVRQWAGLMRRRGHPVVYLDAFEADHHDDAFFAILGALLKSLQHTSSIPDEEHRTSAVRRIKGAARRLMPAVPLVLDATTGVPLGTVGKLVWEAMAGTTDTSSQSGEIGPGFLDERLRRVQEQEESVESFKEALNGILDESSESGTSNGPVIFIIDELDRCKPSFALSVLERMKHTFAAQGVCFVLVTYLEALADMVRHAYGLKAAERYLDKFFQLRLDIDLVLAGNHTDVPGRYIRHIGSRMGLPEPAREFTEAAIRNLAAIHNLPLRSIERVLLNVALYAKSDGYANRHGELLGVAELCVMKLARPELYREARRDQLTSAAAISFLRLGDWTIRSDSRQRREAWWRMATDWVTEGADREVVARMSHRAKDVRYPFSIGQDDTLDKAKAAGFGGWLSSICNDIDLFWQGGNG